MATGVVLLLSEAPTGHITRHAAGLSQHIWREQRDNSILDGIHFCKAWIFEEAETCDPKNCVEYIHHIPGTVRKSP